MTAAALVAALAPPHPAAGAAGQIDENRPAGGSGSSALASITGAVSDFLDEHQDAINTITAAGEQFHDVWCASLVLQPGGGGLLGCPVPGEGGSFQTLAEDLVGITHALDCFDHGDAAACAWTAASIIPAGGAIGRGGRAITIAARHLDDAARIAPRVAGLVDDAVRMHQHHTVPREILRQLPDKVANHPLVPGRAGAPNRWPIPESVHRAIHSGPGGGAYNKAWKDALEGLLRRPKVEDVLRIRDQLTKQFGIDIYRP